MKRFVSIAVGLLCAVVVGDPGDRLAAQPRPTFSEGAASQSKPAGPFPSFNSDRLDAQLRLYQQFLEESGPPDVLIVGSSRSLQGIDPIALEQALAHHGYPGVRVFNFGINGATAQAIDVLLRDIFTPEQLPQLILWADGVRAFNSGRRDRTYEAIVTSAGYERLSQGDRPLSLPAPPVEVARVNAIAPTETKAIVVTPSDDPREMLATSYQAVRGWLSLVGTELRETYQERQQEMSWLGGEPAEPPPPLPTLDAVMSGQLAEHLQPTGFFPVTDRYDPATYYQTFPRVPGRYDGDYAAFSLQGEQQSALRAIARFSEAQQIPLVIVNLPLTEDYLDPTRSDAERLFREQMQRLAAEHNFIFRDLSQLWPTRVEYFADPSHLNRFGAFAVALELAGDPEIPWSATRE
ncbi:hypothetical protein JJD41_09730 [Oxynema sp. CENA135]|uniref:hypothetical protein n=1 Tax=Oxynema sp. CENA135 TaxID=984206 RepID=UPI00190C2CBB|nr:hypothetical protein [Oxynema sp. CENA135]MBK4730135.1 hypothetical protein [Oxynema sp. CENA135]